MSNIIKEYSEADYFTAQYFACGRNRGYMVSSDTSHMQNKDARNTIIMIPTEFDKGELANSIGKVMRDHTGQNMDKWAKQKRIDYVLAHIDTIRRHVKDYAGTASEWLSHKDPEGYMSEAVRFIASVDDNEPNGTMCGSDATCSGLQVVAGLVRSRAIGQMVNLTATTEYHDAYVNLVDWVKDNYGTAEQIFYGNFKHDGFDTDQFKALSIEIADIINNKIGRGYGKAGLMKITYGASTLTTIDDVRDLLIEDKIVEPLEWIEGKLAETNTNIIATVLGTIVSRGAREIGREALVVMSWITDIARAVGNKGGYMVWHDTNGNKMHNNKYLTSKAEYSNMIGEKGAMKLKKVNQHIASGTLDRDGMLLSAAVNVIHSLDANIMANVASVCADRNIPLETIHDQFKTTSNHMAELDIIIREQFAVIFSQDILLSIVESNRELLSDDEVAFFIKTCPMVNDLDVNEISNNMYGFS